MNRWEDDQEVMGIPNPAMLTECEYSLIIAAVVGRIVDYTELRNFRAADILRSALKKIENELVAESTRVTVSIEGDGQLSLEWPTRP